MWAGLGETEAYLTETGAPLLSAVASVKGKCHHSLCIEVLLNYYLVFLKHFDGLLSFFKLVFINVSLICIMEILCSISSYCTVGTN